MGAGRVPGFGKEKGRSGSQGVLPAFQGTGVVCRRAAVDQHPAIPSYGPIAPKPEACVPRAVADGAWWSKSGGSCGALRPCFVCLAFFGYLACPGAEV